MRKRNREFNIFSLSAVDLFCAGMGAVMLLMIILMPFYLRPEVREILEQLARARAEIREVVAQRDAANAALAESEAAREAAETARAEAERRGAEAAGALAQAEAERDQARAEADELRGKLTTPFLVVIISWDNSNDDVDLHVTDPNGRRFYYNARRHPGTPAYIEVDSINGPGNEVWIHPAATAGVYRVEYVFFADRTPTGPVDVRGVAVFQGGRLEFPMVRLPGEHQTNRHFAADLVVSPDGEVSLR